MFFTKKLFVPFMIVLVFSTLALIIWHDQMVIIVKSILPISEPQLNIMFVETKSGKVNFNLREICVIESAAFHHPDSRITLYNVNGGIDENARDIASHYSTIHFQSLNTSDLFMNTPLEKWSEEKRILQSKYPTEHLSDAVRLALLWKHGGMYIDTDIIIIKPFYEFENAIGSVSNPFGVQYAGNAAMIFQKNSTFIYRAMQLFPLFNIGFLWGVQGPFLMTYLLTVWCNVYWLPKVINKPELCQNIRVLPENAVAPVSPIAPFILFSKGSNSSLDFSQSYAVHMYGSVTRSYLVKTGEDTAAEALFKVNCPYTYQLMLKKKDF